MLENNYWTVQQLLVNLNKALTNEPLNIIELCKTCIYINKTFSKRISFINLEINNSDYLISIERKKKEFIKSHNFVAAADCRDIQKKCERIVELKDELNVTESKFYYHNCKFLYFYTGAVKNDKKVMEILKVNNWIDSIL